jgi:hypothetical protein
MVALEPGARVSPRNTGLLLSDQMLFCLCTATAVWRAGRDSSLRKIPIPAVDFN